MSVLIIEEQALVCSTIMASLMELGIVDVKTAENAYFAVRLCDEMKFDIVLISFNVKSDKDGFHLLEELKFKGHITHSTTVIFLSADTDPGLVNCVIELQPSDFWVKPLDNQKVIKRLKYVLTIKEKLHKLTYCMDHGEYTLGIYYAERQLASPPLKNFYPMINRKIGECLYLLSEFKDAEKFFRKLNEQYKFPWVKTGLVWAMLQQGKIEESEQLIKLLDKQEDCKFLLHDMLAQYHIEKEAYETAYEEIKKATELAPRNIERNKRSCDLARLNHDRKGQYIATQNMAKYAKNSIHDSPDLRLNEIRAAIDLATTMTTEEAKPILKMTDRTIANLEEDYGQAGQLKDQLQVIKIRMHSVRDEKGKAEVLLKENMSLEPKPAVEDNLDKVKAFHELGYREESVKLLDSIKDQISGDSFASRVVSEYINQESIERSEIHFTPKELGEMAEENVEQNRMKPALTNLSQAFQLSPTNGRFALSMLQVLTVLQTQDELDEHQIKLATDASKLLSEIKLNDEQQAKFSEYKKALGPVLQEQ